jgi:hypothetical protein
MALFSYLTLLILLRVVAAGLSLLPSFNQTEDPAYDDDTLLRVTQSDSESDTDGRSILCGDGTIALSHAGGELAAELFYQAEGVEESFSTIPNTVREDLTYLMVFAIEWVPSGVSDKSAAPVEIVSNSKCGPWSCRWSTYGSWRRSPTQTHAVVLRCKF